MTLRIGALAAHFRRDLDHDLERISWVLRDARDDGIGFLVLPHAALGGYHDGLEAADARTTDLPPAIDLDGPEIEHIRRHARATTVCFGVTERRGSLRANTAVCLSGDGVLGVHRKVHLPVGEHGAYLPGSELAAFDTPVGRVGMLVDHDKTFPETARGLALDGAEVVAIPSAWPASREATAASVVRDRQRRMFDLYDQARAAENQLVVVSANQTGRHGKLRFFGRSKIVRPDGDIATVVGGRAGIAVTELDVAATVADARTHFHHVAERRVRYGSDALDLGGPE